MVPRNFTARLSNFTQIYDYLDRMLRLSRFLEKNFEICLKTKMRFIEIFWRIPDGSFSFRPTINASPMNMSRCEAFVAPRHLRRMYPERETSWRILTKEMVMALFPGSKGFHAIFTSKV